MADPRRISTRRAVLSYSQIKELNPNFKDLMVKDYQGILQDFSFSSDEIDDLEVRVVQNEVNISYLLGRIFKTTIITSDLTAKAFQVVLCKNSTPIVVTLDPDAVVDDMIHVMRKDAEVEVIGQINGLTDRTINVVNYSELYIFDGTEWSTI